MRTGQGAMPQQLPLQESAQAQPLSSLQPLFSDSAPATWHEASTDPQAQEQHLTAGQEPAQAGAPHSLGGQTYAADEVGPSCLATCAEQSPAQQLQLRQQSGRQEVEPNTSLDVDGPAQTADVCHFSKALLCISEANPSMQSRLQSSCASSQLPCVGDGDTGILSQRSSTADAADEAVAGTGVEGNAAADTACQLQQPDANRIYGLDQSKTPAHIIDMTLEAALSTCGSEEFSETDSNSGSDAESCSAACSQGAESPSAVPRSIQGNMKRDNWATDRMQDSRSCKGD